MSAAGAKRRLLYFSRDYTPHDYRFLSALAQTEYQVYFLRLERGRLQTEDRPLPEGIQQVHWQGGQRPVSRRDGLRLLLALKRVLHEVKPDLVQAGPLQRCALLVALSGFRPLVSTSWGYDLILDAGRSPLWRWATRFTLKRSAVMIGDSQIVRQLVHFHAPGVLPDDRIITFPWGVDLQHFRPLERPLSKAADSRRRPFTLLSARNWEAIYGVDLIAQAFVRACQCLDGSRSDLRLIMLGQGSQAAQIRQILQRLDNEQVSFPGLISYADLPRYYRMADLYVSASHSDGASISLLEALASGLPALVSDIPGNREWVHPGLNGWLFRDGDVNALTEAILQAFQAWQNKETLREMGRQSRRIAEEGADWSKNFPKLLQAYQLALDMPQP